MDRSMDLPDDDADPVEHIVRTLRPRQYYPTSCCLELQDDFVVFPNLVSQRGFITLTLEFTDAMDIY